MQVWYGMVLARCERKDKVLQEKMTKHRCAASFLVWQKWILVLTVSSDWSKTLTLTKGEQSEAKEK